jgi:uncharacterized protein YcbX
MTAVGRVAALWRYPVKSMLGEELDSSSVGERGLAGDRAYALVDAATGKVASAKNPRLWGRLLSCRAAMFESQAAAGSAVTITLPDGTTASSQDPGIDALLSGFLVRTVTLARTAPAKAVLEEYWPDMTGVSPEGHRDTVTDERIGTDAPRGSFFDAAPVHVLTTATLERLGELFPAGRFDARRFRPNIVVETSSDTSEFAENSWLGCTLAIGDARLPVIDPVARCVMTTLAQGDLPRDPGILRATAEHNRIKIPGYGKAACAGVYTAVNASGTISRGDDVWLT